jgi:hypothetical protein
VRPIDLLERGDGALPGARGAQDVLHDVERELVRVVLGDAGLDEPLRFPQDRLAGLLEQLSRGVAGEPLNLDLGTAPAQLVCDREVAAGPSPIEPLM